MVAPLNSKNNQETTTQKKTTMKINRFKVTFILLSTFASVALSGCSNEDNIESQSQEGMAKISFKINEKDYEAGEQVAGTRAATPTKPELQDLGNGWMAEVSLEPDTTHAKEAKAAEAKTRAIYVPAHYTIQAYQGGVKKGELKGTFQGPTFTPDAGTAESIFLPHGTYDFVCFNDKVSANGTQLTVHRADAATARFTVQRGVVINQDPKQYVAFEMKHAGALVGVDLRFVNCNINIFGTNDRRYTNPWEGTYVARSINPTDHIQYSWTSNSNSIPETMNYDFVTNTYSYPTVGNYSYSSKVDWGTTMSPGKTNIYRKNTGAGYAYFLPTTDCANLKFTITDGSLYDRSLTGMIAVPIQKQLEANKSYTLVVRLLMTKPLYLFSDGTIGDLDKNVGKTPIGVIPRPDENYAIALNDVVDSYGVGSANIQWSNATTQETSRVYTNYKDLLREGVSEASGTIPAVQAAASYQSQVSRPSTAITSWMVPGLSRFLWLGVSFAGLPERNFSKTYSISDADNFHYLIPTGASTTGFTPGPSNINFPSMNMTRFNKAFTDAGGTAPEGRYWTDTEVIDGGQAKQVVIDISSSGYRIDFASKQSSAKIRPVIYLKSRWDN